MSAKIAILDIETAPNLGWTWGKWDQNVIAFEKEWYILSFAYKWLGSSEITVRGLCDYPDYEKDIGNDHALLQDLWKVFDEADIIVAHNGDAFDVKKSQARFAIQKLPRPSTFKTIDTLKIAKKNFKFESNKLGDLGEYFQVGTKLPHAGFSVWRGCMKGDVESWKTLKEYNAQDVLLLEQVYLVLRPWASNHPNLNLYSDREACPTCQSDNVEKRGPTTARTRKYQRWHCKECGAWYQGKLLK